MLERETYKLLVALYKGDKLSKIESTDVMLERARFLERIGLAIFTHSSHDPIISTGEITLDGRACVQARKRTSRLAFAAFVGWLITTTITAIAAAGAWHC